MALIVGPDGSESRLRANHLVGRSPGSDLCIARPRVSSRHATLRWTGRGWTIRDLGSTNGTWVGGERLNPGEERVLVVGDRLIFGIRDELFTVTDVDAPRALAEQVQGTEVRTAEDDLIALPDDETPELVVHATERGWVVERTDGVVDRISDGAVVEAGGVDWRLFLPEPTMTTERLDGPPRTLHDVPLEILHSLDEETVQLRVREGDTVHDLPHRAHHELVLVLARQRLEDASRPDLPPAEHGWVDQELLLSWLRTNSNALYQHIHRVRRQFQRLGWPDGADVVQRRPGQVRLGIGQVRVGPLES